LFVFAASQMRGEFEALGFASRKGCGRLAQAEEAEADFVEDGRFGDYLGDVYEKGERFADGELQDFVHVFSVIAHLENGTFEASASAFFADKFNVSQELHLARDGA